MAKWVLLFFLVPLIEMYILIEVGSVIGAWSTILLVLLTAFAGVSLIRLQGLATLARGFSRLNVGELPAGELGEGIILGFAGALMLTPGFVTDAVGFVLLIPVIRRRLALYLMGRVHALSGRGKQAAEDADHTIEGDFKRR